jgi:hypothetical protein
MEQETAKKRGSYTTKKKLELENLLLAAKEFKFNNKKEKKTTKRNATTIAELTQDSCLYPPVYLNNDNTCVKCDDIREHVRECYKNKYRDGSILKLPAEKTYMKFKNYKNKLERPFYVSFDGEACLVHQHVANSEAKTKQLDKHVINSCCFNFICTFDSSRNQLYTSRGVNCLEEMVKKLTELSD